MANTTTTSQAKVIRSATELLDLDSTHTATQATLLNTDKTVLLIDRNFTQAELDAFNPYLVYEDKEMWLERNGLKTGSIWHPKPCPADEPICLPVVSTTFAIARPEATPGDIVFKLDDEGNYDNRTDLVYVLVVQGASGIMKGKVRHAYSWEAMACMILEEVMSGYSVVFTAVMLKSRMHESEAFNRVATGEELHSDGMNEGMTAGLLC